jgi:hypothetical protein
MEFTRRSRRRRSSFPCIRHRTVFSGARQVDFSPLTPLTAAKSGPPPEVSSQ